MFVGGTIFTRVLLLDGLPTLGMEVNRTLGKPGNEAAVLNYPSLLACNTASNPGHSPLAQFQSSDREEEGLAFPNYRMH